MFGDSTLAWAVDYFPTYPIRIFSQYLTMLAARALSEASNEHGIGHMANVVLFPWLTMLTGCFIYYLISRSRVKMPYTAVMFIVGTVMGYCAKEDIGHNAVTESTKMWIGIDGEVLLLAFLPGLLFLDSYESNVYLFKKAISQLLVFAFPMGLCGTILTALVAYFVLPYGWSRDLCMLLGSILAATDPVVSVHCIDRFVTIRSNTHNTICPGCGCIAKGAWCSSAT